ncbi:MAG: hypothetical protein WDO13_13965 [Verrucomicrobiota bacterium]
MGRGGVSQTLAAWVSSDDIFSSSFFWISGQFWLMAEVVLALMRPRSTESRPLRLISAGRAGPVMRRALDAHRLRRHHTPRRPAVRSRAGPRPAPRAPRAAEALHDLLLDGRLLGLQLQRRS